MLMQFALIVSTLLCSLVAGLVFSFAIVVMPGIRNLDDLGYLRSFKAMDRVIQDNQPVFMLAWIGSAVSLLLSGMLGIWQLNGLDQFLLFAACVIYLLGVQLPTVTINIPLNNRLQSLDLDTTTETGLSETRDEFESRWLFWNALRTAMAILTTALLLVLLVRL